MIRILLVDDQSIIRQGLKALLELHPDLQVVGTAKNGQTAIEQVEALQPDVVLIDILMPEMDGVAATQIIAQRFPETKVLVLSGYDDDEYIADALRAGAKGYLLKDTPAEELANAILSVHKGYAQTEPGLCEKISFGTPASNVDSDQVSPGLSVLTPLELEVLRQLKSFDIKALLEVVRLAVEWDTVVRVLAHVNNQLNRDPTNLAALYLAGTLWARRGEGHKMVALHYLKWGFKEAIKQGLSPEGFLLFYKEAALLESGEAFTWLTEVNGSRNNEEGLSFLLQEVAQMFGLDSTHYRALLVLQQVRAMRALSDGCTALEPMLEVLHQGFERFDKVLNI